MYVVFRTLHLWQAGFDALSGRLLHIGNGSHWRGHAQNHVAVCLERPRVIETDVSVVLLVILVRKFPGAANQRVRQRKAALACRQTGFPVM